MFDLIKVFCERIPMSFFATNLKKAALCTFLSFILVAGLMPVGAVASEENDLVGIAETLPENLVEENSDGETLDSYDEYNTEKQEEDVLGSSSQEAFEEDSTKDEATTQEISKTTTEEVKPFANNLQSGNIQLVSKAHIQNIGDVSYPAAQKVRIGTSGQAKRLEALTLSLQNNTGITGSIQYRVHVQNIGWQGIKNSGESAGSKARSLRIESVRIALTGDLAKRYDVYYRTHVQNVGWLPWASNGAPAGSEGYSNRLESLEVAIVQKGNTDQLKQIVDGSIDNAKAFKFAEVTYRDHCQNVGWKSHNASSLESNIRVGVKGQSKRLEAFAISIKRLNANNYADLNKSIYRNGEITYQAHVQNVGWQSAQKDGSVAGTVNRAQRVEAVRISLTGDLSSDYDAYYRSHVGNIGDLGWTKNNAESGTVGASVRIEAIDIKLVRKGGAAPGSTQVPFVTNSMAQISYGALPMNSSWVNTSQGGVAGTTGKSKAVSAIKAAISQTSISGGVQYRTHVANVGWLGYVSSGESRSGSRAAQAIQMKLTGELSKYYDIYYRAHISGYGWMGWAKNGTSAGTTGLNKNLETYQVRLVVKGSPAPGSTAKSFSDQNGFLGVPPAYKAFVNKANQYSSLTGWIILVDTNAHRAAILSGSRGNWKISRQFAVTTGAPSTPTIKGVFQTTGFKRPNLSTDSRARWCTQIKGGYFFHTILASTNELGKSQSHGCVRLAIPDAQWIYNNIGRGTTVVIY